MPKPSLPDRFWPKVTIAADDECWIWTGAIAGEGYGWYYREGTRGPAHRFSYEALVGPIPPGLQIDHLCRVRNCVNPAHLEAVTQRVNMLRGVGPSAEAARQTTCSRGHDLNDPANVYGDHPSRPNCRTCKPCAVRRAREARAKKRLERQS